MMGKRNVVKVVLVALVATMLLWLALPALPTLAAEGGDPAYPWDDAMLAFGGVAVAVGVLVRTLIQFAKHVQVNGNPLLPTEASIHLANVLLGGILFAVVNLTNGADAVSAIVQSVIAIVSAIGGHELIGFLQRAFGGSSNGSPEDQSAPTGTATP